MSVLGVYGPGTKAKTRLSGAESAAVREESLAASKARVAQQQAEKAERDAAVRAEQDAAAVERLTGQLQVG